ncbi:nuclear transport factor 2 family protein [Sphingobacterium chungjuense]|uniref:nuclear transport factor 2 family protein n=1 Tax=Sphingobacterium chungjuense TaxID=2675553 RepID=UPI00140D13E3|nr:nuclear transport factor 2 family protein [Sphingobacterium chungjuense]
MKTYILFVLSFIHLSFSSKDPSYASMEKITETEVAKVMEHFRLALLKPESDALRRLTHPYLTYGHSSGLIEDQEEFIHSLTSGKFRFQSLQFQDADIRIIGSTAIVRHIMAGISNDRDKPPGTIHLHVVLVWQKNQGSIQLLMRQAVKL